MRLLGYERRAGRASPVGAETLFKEFGTGEARALLVMFGTLRIIGRPWIDIDRELRRVCEHIGSRPGRAGCARRHLEQ